MGKHSPRITSLKILTLLIAVVLVVVAGLAIWNRLETPTVILKPKLLYQATQAKPLPLTWPASGQAAIGTPGYGVLETHGVQKPVPTASVAKLITVLAVLKVKPLAAGTQGPTLTLGQGDVDIYSNYAAEGGSVAMVTDDEQISEYQMIQAMLLPSANNMADSLAIWAFGSLSSYAAYANQMLSTLSLNHTHVGSDASGFQPDTTSTPSDLVLLGEIAEANPIISAIANQSSAEIPVAGTVHNVDWLLGTDGINGLKTGNSDQAGGVFLFSAPSSLATGHSVTIIGAVMDQPSLLAAMNSGPPLLTSVQKAFTYPTIIPAGQAVAEYAVPWGKTITAVAT